VGGVVRPSRRAIFVWWFTVPVVTTWRCCLVCAAWRMDGVCPDRGDGCLLSLSGVSGRVPALVRAGVLGGPWPFSIPSRGQDGGEVMRRMVKGEGRGRGRLPISALGPGPHSLVGPWSLGLVLACLSWAAQAAN
jgi:hypothetical protein